MRHLLMLFPLLLCACVSGALAKSNLDSVQALGQMAIDKDPTAEPEATAAAENAAEIVEATAPLTQITHLGIPSELIDKNSKHVDNLSLVVLPDADKPKIKMGIENAKSNADKLKDKVHQQQQYVAAGKGLPYADDVMAILTGIGSLIGVAYGATRGQKHVRNWWNTPGKKIPPKPAPLPGDIAT
jgi:hypothetical protein